MDREMRMLPRESVCARLAFLIAWRQRLPQAQAAACAEAVLRGFADGDRIASGKLPEVLLEARRRVEELRT